MRVSLVKHIKILQLLYELHVSSSKLVLLSEQSERKGHRPPEAGLGRDVLEQYEIRETID